MRQTSAARSLHLSKRSLASPRAHRGRTRFWVTFHGVAGSTPCHGEDVQRYGGNTSCVSAVPGQRPILFDLDGLRYFGLTRPIDGTFRGKRTPHPPLGSRPRAAVLQADPRRRAELDIYGPVQPDGRHSMRPCGTSWSPPHFPVGIDALPGTIGSTTSGNTEFRIGDAEITSASCRTWGTPSDSA
ncbi:MAG: hypothetical protein R2705_09960 [Ilumatobacteraceae bacterium]